MRCGEFCFRGLESYQDHEEILYQDTGEDRNPLRQVSIKATFALKAFDIIIEEVGRLSIYDSIQVLKITKIRDI